MFTRHAASAVCLLGLLLLTGCPGKETPKPSRKSPGMKLVIGLIPEQNIFHQFERYEPLMKYVGDKVEVQFELKVLPRYGNIVDNFQSLGLDGAFLGSFTYVLAHARLGLHVLARPENDNGVSTYYGMIFVRKDSRIRTVRDMKGKRLACVDKATTAGYLLPMAYFHEHAVRKPRQYLAEIYFTGTHENAIADVLDRKADIGAAKNTVFERMAAKAPRIRNELQVLAVSPDVPENALALRGNLEETTRRKILDALLGMDRDPAGREVLKKFGARRFVPTTDKDYDAVIRYAGEIHIDLATYDYIND